MSEGNKGVPFGEQCARDAQVIGEHLRSLNMKPTPPPFKNDEGLLVLGTLAAPETAHSIDVLKLLGRGSVTL